MVGDLVLIGSGDAEFEDISEAIAEKRQTRQNVILLETEEQCKEYTIHDVCLPLPGHSIMYPKHEVGEQYKSFMAKNGFDPDSMGRKLKDISLPGFYRKIVGLPRDMSWEFIRYEGEDDDLIQSDLQVLNNEPIPAQPENASKLALLVEFTLSTSQYATMALREITKSETGATFHAGKSIPLKRKFEDETREE
jgi:tRNA pseudouridine13 synthase